MKYNIVLVIVDCLRYDTAKTMDFLESLGWMGHWFGNHWATSHCTDPCVTHMLTGKHPDELGLYSMMFDDRKYTIPDTKSIFHMANEEGYDTAFVTNLQRWYQTMFGAKHFVDSRHFAPERDYEIARNLVKNLAEPYLLVFHTAHMHTAYYGGSYQEAAKFTNEQLVKLFMSINEQNTTFMVTADHGEGLGQLGVDGQRIDQHGYGLADFLAHIPLVVKPPSDILWEIGGDTLTDHGTTYDLMNWIVMDSWPLLSDKKYVFQAGATPKVFHRGVVDKSGRQFIRITKGDMVNRYWVGEFGNSAEKDELEVALRQHCADCEIEYGETAEEAEIASRLEGLGYWSRK